jgi:hypothetical protein
MYAEGSRGFGLEEKCSSNWSVVFHRQSVRYRVATVVWKVAAKTRCAR